MQIVACADGAVTSKYASPDAVSLKRITPGTANFSSSSVTVIKGRSSAFG
jgi:hypothetical protein